jgi:hypothetical protein
MTIYDHVLAFANEAAAQAALPQYYSAVASSWDQSRELVSPEEVLPGFWVAIALTELSTTLRDLPNEACRLITDRDAANAGQSFAQFTVYASPSLDLQAVQSYRVAPVFAGSKYPFGV